MPPLQPADVHGSIGGKHALVVATLALGVLVSACDEAPPPSRWTDGTDRLVVLPDTQCYSRFYPEIFNSQGDLISMLTDRSDVLHAIHVGDITDLNSETEWSVARTALGPLVGMTGITLVTGNHDLGENGTASDRSSRIDAFFGDLATDFTFDGSVQNSASLVGDDWMVVGLEFAPRAEVIAWANGVIEAHPDRYVVIATHAYLYADGERYDATAEPPQAYHPNNYTIGRTGADGSEVWSELASRHANVRFVVSGHVPGTYAVSPARGDAGNLVWDIVVDFQEVPCRPMGDDGEGYLLVLELLQGQARALIYSPWRDAELDVQLLDIEPLEGSP